LLLIFPVIVYYALFHYLPMYGVTIAFKEYRILDGIMGSPWIGFENFRKLFAGNFFPRAIRNTVILSAMGLAVFPVPIIFALLINEVRHLRYKKFVQSVSYLPSFMSWAVLGAMFINLLSSSRGVLAFTGLDFLSDPETFRFTLVLTGLWMYVGWDSIIYLAAITGVDPGLYESAKLDGANRLQMMWYITIPSVMPVISIIFILNIGRILNSNRDQILVMQNPITYATSDTLDVYAYKVALRDTFNYSFGAAVDLFKNVIGCILLVIVNTVARKTGDGENALF